MSERTEGETHGAAPSLTRTVTADCAEAAAASDLPNGPFPVPFGRYELRAVLGKGGMGKVYRAFDPRLGVEVAVKIPIPDLIAHPVARQRFEREAQTLARLNHPNLSRIFHFDECDGLPFLTMAFIAGTPLFDLRYSASTPGAQTLSVEQAIDITRVVAKALAYLHRSGLVHRDIKPLNIILNSDGEPVIVDFGLAISTRADEPRLSAMGYPVGTLAYMPPEQIGGNAIPASDIYSLGAALYELVTGRLPFEANAKHHLIGLIVDPTRPAPAPSAHRPGISPAFDAVCLRALAKEWHDRFASMGDFAAALESCLRPSSPDTTARLDPSAIRFRFVGPGETAPPDGREQDRLYLDVGNALAAGVVDHHHLAGSAASTTSLVLANPDLVSGALRPWRKPADPFTILLHQHPDLDSVAAAYLASRWLQTESFPEGSLALARYVDRVDAGHDSMTRSNPATLHTAFRVLAHRLVLRKWKQPADQWESLVRDGLQLVEYVADTCGKRGQSVLDIDAFESPGLFGPADRREVQDDLLRYERKLADPACGIRIVTLNLPGEMGGRLAAPTLFARNVQNPEDPDRCAFFKEWARTDSQRCPETAGFVGLCIYMGTSADRPARCVISVRPDFGCTLWGLGQRLDRAESLARVQAFGIDDRLVDPQTREPKPLRPGYTNSDPWYDGRAHRHTIVDSPRSGTLLTADEIEGIVRDYAS